MQFRKIISHSNVSHLPHSNSSTAASPRSSYPMLNERNASMINFQTKTTK